MSGCETRALAPLYWIESSLGKKQERLEDKNVLLAKIGAIICRVHCSKLLRKDVKCEITLIFMLISSKFK